MDDHCQAGEREAALEREGGHVVEQAIAPAGPLEDELADEEDAAREAEGDFATSPYLGRTRLLRLRRRRTRATLSPLGRPCARRRCARRRGLSGTSTILSSPSASRSLA
jgi:hypothetical protein